VYQRVETLVRNVPQGPQAHYLHRDHLTSVDRLRPAISSGSGVMAYSFDAFGGRRAMPPFETVGTASAVIPPRPGYHPIRGVTGATGALAALCGVDYHHISLAETSMSAVSDEVATVLRHLPKDSTLEDVQYGLYVLEKIKNGLADVEAGRIVTQAEVEQRLAKWLSV
jgi:hypothetical protein